MGLMDMIQSLAGQTGAAAGTDQAKVAGGFIEALTQHPEGIQGVLDAFKNNGMASHIGAWGAGQRKDALKNHCHMHTQPCTVWVASDLIQQ